MDPRAMTELWCYAYYVGICSSRKIEKAFDDSLGFRVIFPHLPPDHSTISRFRKDIWDVLEGLFPHVLAECKKDGLIDPGTGIVDGSKIMANASLSANAMAETVEKKMLQLAAEEAAAQEEEKRLPRTTRAARRRGRKSRKERLECSRKKLAAKTAACLEEEKRHEEARAQKEAETGKKLRGRKPRKVTVEELSRGKVNTTDPDSEIMKTSKGFVQGYNGQIVVTRHQIILAANVTQEHNDMNQLHPMLQETWTNLDTVGIGKEALGEFLADAGYCSKENLRPRECQEVEILSPPKKDRELRALLDAFKDDPAASPLAEAPRTTPEGMAAYLRVRKGMRATRSGERPWSRPSDRSRKTGVSAPSCAGGSRRVARNGG